MIRNRLLNFSPLIMGAAVLALSACSSKSSTHRYGDFCNSPCGAAQAYHPHQGYYADHTSQMNGQMNGHMNSGAYFNPYGQMAGQMGGQMNGQMNMGYSYYPAYIQTAYGPQQAYVEEYYQVPGQAVQQTTTPTVTTPYVPDIAEPEPTCGPGTITLADGSCAPFSTDVTPLPPTTYPTPTIIPSYETPRK